jgi:hypothetical protein
MDGRVPIDPPSHRRRYRTSMEVNWRESIEERYFDGSLDIDVGIAKRFLATVPVPVEYVPAGFLAPWMHSQGGRSGPRSAPIRARPSSPIDVDIPLIFIDLLGDPYLIDGHHRLEEARRRGFADFPVTTIRDEPTVRSAMRARSAPFVYWWIWKVRHRFRHWRRRTRSS